MKPSRLRSTGSMFHGLVRLNRHPNRVKEALYCLLWFQQSLLIAQVSLISTSYSNQKTLSNSFWTKSWVLHSLMHRYLYCSSFGIFFSSDLRDVEVDGICLDFATLVHEQQIQKALGVNEPWDGLLLKFLKKVSHPSFLPFAFAYHSFGYVCVGE